MARIVKHISVDVAAENIFQSIIAKQYDSDSRFLTVRLTNEGEQIDVSPNSVVIINALREDNEAQAFAGTVNDDGTITVPITYWMLELDGQVKCDISVIDSDERKLTSTSFSISVEAAAYAGTDVSEDDNYNVLVSLIAECTEATSAALKVAEGVSVDQEYTPESANAQSGVAVAQAISELRDLIQRVAEKEAYITLTADGWVTTDVANRYSQVVTLDNITAKSTVVLDLNLAQVEVFREKDLTFFPVSGDGVVTVYAVGQKPTNDYTLKARFKEAI